MEIPPHIKNLYRHWGSYIIPRVSVPLSAVIKNESLNKEIEWFIHERISIWKKKISGAPPPYTNDAILSQYRFCNIFRECDKQTIEFHTLLNPLRDNFPLWLLNMFYCRMVARTETIHNVGLLSFDEKSNKELYKKLMSAPRPRFGTPYVFPISVLLRSETPTRELFITNYLPKIIPAIAEEIATWHEVSVYEGVRRILPLFGYNLSFLWTEVLIDVAYQFPERINLFGRFPVGPGALPTFKKIHPTQDPSVLAQELSTLDVDVGLTFERIPLRLSAENWEGIGCEFRKYTNLKAGKGRKRIYRA